MLGAPVMRFTAQWATSAWQRRCVDDGGTAMRFHVVFFFFFFGDKCCQLWMDERRLIVRLVSRLLHWQTALLTHSRARVETLKFEKRDNTQTKPNRTNATAQLTAGCVSPKTKTKNKNKNLESAKRNNDPNVSLLRVLVTVPMTSCCTLALAFSQNWVNWSWYFLTSIYCSYWF